MARDFEVVAWMDDDSIRHAGKPGDIYETYGVLLHVYDPENPGRFGFHDYLWMFVPGAFDDWEDWYDYIVAMGLQHGFEFPA